MLFIESILLAFLLLGFAFFKPIKTKYAHPYTILIIELILFHFTFENFRWQMIPAYLLTAFLSTKLLWPRSNSMPIVLKAFQLLLLSILFIFGIVLPLLFPVFQLPKPTGPFQVGTTDVLLQLERKEAITSDPNDKRALMIKAWYPTSGTSKPMDPYIDPAGRHGFAMKYGLPKTTLQYLDQINTHTYKDAKVANGQFPVLIFSHGYNSKANGYYTLLSELASQGYIIFAINHSYESTGSTFPDGGEIYFNYEFAHSIEKDTWQMIQPVKDAFANNLSFEERHPIVKKGLTTYFVKDMVERWANDISDVVNQLDLWNTQGLFKGHLNTDAIGVFGHSRGGGAAGHAHLKDKRIKAGVNIDGVQWGDIVNTSFQQPFMFISADWPDNHEDLNAHAYIHKSTDIFYEAKLLHSAHSNFMDIPLMIPFKPLSQAGTIDPVHALNLTNTLLTGFFNQHLKNQHIDWNQIKDAELEFLIHE